MEKETPPAEPVKVETEDTETFKEIKHDPRFDMLRLAYQNRFVKSNEILFSTEPTKPEEKVKEEEAKSVHRSKIVNEDDLYLICGKSELRSFRQEGKLQRYVFV